jgi:two-component sensor histidine kinase
VSGKERVLESENARLRSLLDQAGVDAAASEVASKLQKLLLAEMHHRIKNLLAMVQAIATQSLRGAKTLDEAREAINNRIVALSRTHDILLSSNSDAARLPALISGVAHPFGDGAITISVPDVEVAAPQAISISLVLNELCTNAVKYGALSTAAGHVSLVGWLEGDTLILRWKESGGPVVRAPTEQTFGTQLIESVAPGQSQLHFPADGVTWEMRMAL